MDHVSKTKSEEKRFFPLSQKQPGNPNRYKTELCRPFQEYGSCRYGDKCQFAHGKEDLRIPIRHPKYKTEYCRTYHSQGYCPYGARCHFVHSTIEARPLPPLGGRQFGLGGIENGTTISTTSSSQSAVGYVSFAKPPLSPSQDSGISSPEGTPTSFLASKVFEYPSSDSSSSDDQDPDYCDTTFWQTNEVQLIGEWDDTLSTDSFSPNKAPPIPTDHHPLDDLTEKFSSTSLDDGFKSSSRSRLPVFNQLNSASDTLLTIPRW